MKRKKVKRSGLKIALLFTLEVLLAVCFFLTGCWGPKTLHQGNIPAQELESYETKGYVVLNDNVPEFTEEDLTTQTKAEYEKLDDLGRCGTAEGCLSKELFPTKEREAIQEVHPSGWQSQRYDFVEGGYLYNRSHLIAFRLAGENANPRNLITGTRYLNASAMEPFEAMVAGYLERTGNHVLYRVSPIFAGEELLCRGVHMEALSVEDEGRGIKFNVYIPNVQPGVEIDYATGDNRLSGGEDTKAVSVVPVNGTVTSDTQLRELSKETGIRAEVQSQKEDSQEKPSFFVKDEQSTYIVNRRSEVFHDPTCQGVEKISGHNKEVYTGTRQDLLAQGLKPCGTCHP